MQPGDLAPSFELPDDKGNVVSLDALLADGPVVLYFYPAAMTPGCTKESCHFRDLGAEFTKLGAQRVGISLDKVEKQRAFSEKYTFDFPLLADTEGTVAKAFGVKRSLAALKVKRSTFVIDTDKKVLEVINSELGVHKHADRALEVLRQRAAAAS